MCKALANARGSAYTACHIILGNSENSAAGYKLYLLYFWCKGSFRGKLAHSLTTATPMLPFTGSLRETVVLGACHLLAPASEREDKCCNYQAMSKDDRVI